MGMLLRVSGPIVRALACSASVVMLAGCQVEKREIGPTPPATPPTSAGDARAHHFQTNRYEMSEGGRMFRWFGCDGCHTDPAPGYLDLADAAWRRGGSLAEIYGAIAQGAPGMPPYAGRITPQQTWQIAGYVHGLKELKPDQRRRNADAEKGEPSGADWQGPIP
jgi:cytochrome c oxidase cbb3-type subunit 3